MSFDWLSPVYILVVRTVLNSFFSMGVELTIIRWINWLLILHVSIVRAISAPNLNWLSLFLLHLLLIETWIHNLKVSMAFLLLILCIFCRHSRNASVSICSNNWTMLNLLFWLRDNFLNCMSWVWSWIIITIRLLFCFYIFKQVLLLTASVIVLSCLWTLVLLLRNSRSLIVMWFGSIGIVKILILLVRVNIRLIIALNLLKATSNAVIVENNLSDSHLTSCCGIAVSVKCSRAWTTAFGFSNNMEVIVLFFIFLLIIIIIILVVLLSDMLGRHYSHSKHSHAQQYTAVLVERAHVIFSSPSILLAVLSTFLLALDFPTIFLLTVHFLIIFFAVGCIIVSVICVPPISIYFIDFIWAENICSVKIEGRNCRIRYVSQRCSTHHWVRCCAVFLSTNISWKLGTFTEVAKTSNRNCGILCLMRYVCLRFASIVEE